MLGKKYSIGICFSRKKKIRYFLDCFAATYNDKNSECPIVKTPRGGKKSNCFVSKDCKNKHSREKSIIGLLSNCHFNNDRNHPNTQAIFKFQDELEQVSNIWTCTIKENLLGLGKKEDKGVIGFYPGFLKYLKKGE